MPTAPPNSSPYAPTSITRMYSGPPSPTTSVIPLPRRPSHSPSTPPPHIATASPAAACPWGATAGRNPACTVSGTASSPEARPLSPSSRFPGGGRFPAAGALLFHQGPPPTLHPLRHAPQDRVSRQKGPKHHTGKEISADARRIFCSVTEQSTHPKENFRTQPPSRTEPIFSLPTPEHRKTTSENYHLPFPPRHTPIFR